MLFNRTQDMPTQAWDMAPEPVPGAMATPMTITGMRQRLRRGHGLHPAPKTCPRKRGTWHPPGAMAAPGAMAHACVGMPSPRPVDNTNRAERSAATFPDLSLGALV